MENLSVLIANQGKGTISDFAAAHGLDRANLSKCLNGGQDMSVGTFLRVCTALGVLTSDAVLPSASELNRLSLRVYLSLDSHFVLSSVLDIVFA